jgi:hypothetical protein
MNRAVKRLVTLASALALSVITVPAAQSAPAPGSYWTPERMRAAVPLDLRTTTPSALRSTVPTGEPTTIAPLAFPNGGSAWTGGGAVVRTAGRVFFTYQGRNASCSGNAVTRATKCTA